MASANQITAVITADTRRNGYERNQADIECLHDDVHYVWFNSVNFLFYKDGQPYDIYQDPNFSTYLNFH